MGTLLNRRRYMGGGGAPQPSYDENSYTQDGLIFQLDGIAKGGTDGTWTDLIGNMVFTNYGAVEETDGFLFSNSAYLRNSTNLPSNNNYTIEASFNCSTKGVVMSSGGNTEGCIFFYLDDGLLLQRKNKYSWGITLNANTVISANDSEGYRNGQAIQRLTTSDYWGTTGTNIGSSFYGGSRRWFSGKIYAIRVYNRKLTAEEILYNQKVDNVRFNLGLSI